MSEEFAGNMQVGWTLDRQNNFRLAIEQMKERGLTALAQAQAKGEELMR